MNLWLIPLFPLIGFLLNGLFGRRLADGRSELQRQRAVIDETHEHLAGMSRWIEQTDRELDRTRSRRAPLEEDD